jgi:hypothetical protein
MDLIRDNPHFEHEGKKLTKAFFDGHEQIEGRVLADPADFDYQYLSGVRDAQKHALRHDAIHAAIATFEESGSMRKAIEAALGSLPKVNGDC